MVDEQDIIGPGFVPGVLSRYMGRWQLTHGFHWGALWKSPDGRTWAYVHAPDARRLASKLVAAEAELWKRGLRP